MAHERLRPQFLFDEEKIKQLKKIAPECFEDGKINFETLKQNLGEWAQEDEDGEAEHFGLSWPGKREARKMAAKPPEGTLEPVYGEGLKADGTPDTDGVNDSKNIFIEGENLEVLKILQKSYAGKIKMIYIDPPYNTGNDFVYDDDFTEPLQEYLRRTGQIDEEGKPLTTNKRSDGRFHSKWLSMMYPRLRLARNLLHDDGAIFVSIDDNEINNLRTLMTEVFGDENYRGTIVRSTGQTTGQDSGGLGSSFDYVLVFTLNPEVDLSGLPLTEKDIKRFDQEDDIGKYAYDQMRKTGSNDRRVDRPNMYYSIQDPDGNNVFPIGPGGYESCWRFEKKTYLKLVSDNYILWKKTTRNGQEVWWPYVKYYLEGRTKRPSPLWTDLDGNKKAARDLRALFDGKKLFDFPKPIQLLKRLIQINPAIDEDENIVLDFFSGSSSTAHAVFELNKEINEKWQCVSVQIPQLIDEKEEAYKLGYRNLAQLSSERIRKAIKRHEYNSEGFQYLRLKTSNYKKWTNYSGNSASEFEKNLELFNQEPLKEGWRKEGLLSEIILMEGFVLVSTLEKQAQYKKNEVMKVSDEYCEHSLLVCLDKEVKPETIAALELSGNDIFICLDSAISNVDKLRLSDKGLIKTI
ncbi:MAG: site-specific DNA-methyltransferase [Cyclobacteriaceae bacterium]